MADVLDAVAAAIAQVTTDLAAEGTAIQAVLADLQAIEAGNISTSDPRFQAAITALQSADSTITAATTSLNAALPSAPAPAA